MMISRIKSWIYSFSFGFFLPLQAIKLILKNRKLLFWSALPLILTLLISIYGVSELKEYFVRLGMHFLSQYGFQEGAISTQAAIFLIKLLLFFLAAITFSLLAGVIASPFNDLLAEATESHCRPRLAKLPPPKNWKDRARPVLIDIVKTVMVTLLQVICLFFAVVVIWIPGLNVILMLLTFWLLSFQFISYPQTRRHEGLKESVRFLFKHALACAGFGASIGMLFALPLISAFALPLAVVGGTLLYARAKDLTLPLH
jgi:uncharacterized protein involved in cysteine biosynthesis